MDIVFWINAVVYASLFLLSLYLLGRNIYLRKYIAENSVAYLQLVLDSKKQIEVLQNELKKREDNAIEKTDGFLKFVSESREWAFKYIEDVQQAIGVVKVSASYGKVSEESLEKLFSFLPEQQGENNEQGND